MSDGYIVRRGGIGLNYKIIDSPSRPTYAVPENTIWVNTTLNKEDISRVTVIHLPYYIHATSGVVTKPSSNTCYTQYFKCTEGRQYRFQMTDGTTVLIASFTETPNTSVTGTKIYGNGKTNNEDTLDYTVTAPSGAEYLGIWYYDSSANKSVPSLTITDITNINTLPDSLEMTHYAFSATEPENATDGMVWINSSEASSISVDIFKNSNTLMTYLLEAKQKVNGIWIYKEAEIYQNGKWVSLSPFPMSLIPVTDQAKWKTLYGSKFTDEGYITMFNTKNDVLDYLDPIDLSTAGEIIVTYYQNWSFYPILNVINANTGNKEFTITGTTSKIMTLDVSTAKGPYYIQFTSEGHYGDRTLRLESVNITRRT